MKELKWGETPFDSMTRDELLLEVKRMFAAIGAAQTVMALSKNMNENSPFWKEGTGARAVEMCEQISDRYREYHGEEIYRSYYRYATDLLFERRGVQIGHGWAVCPLCGVMLGEQGNGKSMVGERCMMGNTDCPGHMRLLEWSDLEPAKTVG